MVSSCVPRETDAAILAGNLHAASCLFSAYPARRRTMRSRVTVRPDDTGEALVNPQMGWKLNYYSNILANYGSKRLPQLNMGTSGDSAPGKAGQQCKMRNEQCKTRRMQAGGAIEHTGSAGILAGSSPPECRQGCRRSPRRRSTTCDPKAGERSCPHHRSDNAGRDAGAPRAEGPQHVSPGQRPGKTACRRNRPP